MWYEASTIGKCLFDFAVKPNLKRNSDTKNKNGTVEQLKSEVFYGKARVKEIQKYPKTRFEYTGSFTYTQNCADDDLSSVEKAKRNRRYYSRKWHSSETTYPFASFRWC